MGDEWGLSKEKSLRRALRQVPKTLEVNERFKAVAKLVNRDLKSSGGEKVSKKDCHAKYKELKAKGKEAKRKEEGGYQPRPAAVDSWVMSSKAPADDGKAHGTPLRTQLAAMDVEACASGPAQGLFLEEVDDLADFEELAEEGEEEVHPAVVGSGGKGGRELLGDRITKEQAATLHELLFGAPEKTFNDAWVKQGFQFNKSRGKASAVSFGLVQHEGGPCGVLAAVQAYIIEYVFLRSESPKGPAASSQRWGLSEEEQRMALVHSISSILWQCGQGQGAVVALLSPGFMDLGTFRTAERLHVSRCCQSLEDTKDLIRENLDLFTASKGPGVVLFVYSAILSRGVSAIKRDMDQGFGGESAILMAKHGYAAQELVNLLLVGRACSNVFDGEKVMDEGATAEGLASSSPLILQGVPGQGRVGFLTLFEAYKYVAVGRHLKEPKLPVWVVCSESHYSVLFFEGVKQADAKGCELLYYDGLDKQEGQIRLSVCFEPDSPPPDMDDSAVLVPPLDLVIRTKWAGAGVNWNGTEPIL